MSKSTKVLNSLVALTALMIIASYSLSSVEAHEGYEGKRGRHGEKAAMFQLIPPELKSQFKTDYQSLTEAEKQALRQEREAYREEHKSQLESFLGMTQEELRAAKRSGESMGDILSEKGISQEQAESFLTERVSEKVDKIVDRHDLSPEQADTIKSRVTDFVQNILTRWFNK